MTANQPDDRSTPDEPHRPSRWRGVAGAVLVVFGCLLVPLSLLAVWTRNTMLDTDKYVAAVAPLARNQDVRDAGATRITDRIMETTDLADRLTEALPPRAAKAAPAMTDAIEGVVHSLALEVLSSDQFARIWETANRKAQPQIVKALTGGGSNVKLENGEVTVDLGGAAKEVRSRVEGLGLDVNSIKPAGQVDTTLVLFQSSYLAWTQSGVEAVQRLAWFLPVLMLGCFGGAVALSRHRRRTVLRTGFGVAIAAALLLTALNLGRIPYLGLFPRPEGKLAGGAAYDQILSSLRLGGRAVFALGLVVAFGAWVAGPSAGAVRLRGVFTDRERSREPGAFVKWVGRSKTSLRVVAIALGAIALVAVDQPSGLTVLVIALVVLVALAIIEFVGRSATSVPPAT